MSACIAYEDRLLEYAELSPHDRHAIGQHLATCEGCRRYLTILEEVEIELMAHASGVRLDQQLLAGVRQRIAGDVPVARLSKWPEWLDFVAATAVLALMAGLVWTSGLLALAANG